jgi:hypothetical protein
MTIKNTLRSLIYLSLIIMVGGTFISSCSSGKHMSVEQRKKKQTKNKKRHPHGCPQLDCD